MELTPHTRAPNRLPEITCTVFLLLAVVGCAEGALHEGRGLPDAGGSDAGYLADDGGTADAASLPSCVPDSDDDLCAASAVACGPLSVTDNCDTFRSIAECGPCGVTGTCTLGVCVGHTYSWKTGAWGGCSVSCGGGTRTRTVWCERDDGVGVADWLCPGIRPDSSESCNTDPCCSCAAHDACGDDGCGNSCGTCSGGRWCGWGTYCVTSPVSDGSISCNTLCSGQGSVCLGTCLWDGSDCLSPGSYDCATVGAAGLYCYCW